jgi:N-acetylneuraminate synthase
MDHVDLANLVEMIDRYKVSGGYYSKEVLPCEEAARKQARRGLVAKQTLRVGHEITMDDIEVKRPAHGSEPKDLYWLIGRKLNKEIDEDCFIHKEDLV